MTLQHINLDQLKVSPANVRKYGAKQVSDLVTSIEQVGLLQPLLVRPNCEGYEIIAGQRRFNALTLLSKDKPHSEPVPCMVIEDKSDATAIEASLTENITRLPMDEVDQYKAFAALVKQGMECEAIAERFGVTERLVKQRLAIANLLSPILTLYRKDKIHAQTVRLLTMASKAQQKDWLSLYKDEDAHAPEGYGLKNWLFGGEQITTDTALFDLENYQGGIVSDLFGEKSYFDDPQSFWHLQNAAIAKARQTYLNDGWSDVVIWEIGEPFPSYDYLDRDKQDGGKVYIVPRQNGEVTFYEGLVSRKDIKIMEGKGKGDAVTAKPELTKAMQTYLNLHRHASVRTDLLNHQGVALRLSVALLITGANAEAQKAPNDAITASLESNLAQKRFDKEREAVRKLLELEEQDNETLVLRKDDWGKHHDLHGLFARLLALSDEEVLRILTFITAEILPAGSALEDALGVHMDVDLTKDWTPDQCFFDLLRDKSAINAMVAENAGQDVADANVTATAKVQKKIIQDCLNGTRKGKSDWHPAYMAFPMQAYTQSEGIEAIEQWDRVKERYNLTE